MLLTKQKIYFTLFVLALIAVFVWSAIFAKTPENVLEVNFLDVGQGDSIFIEFQNKQILIDGGPDKSVLKELNREMPFYDRNIDLVVLTHPDKDHLFGLIEVLEFFEVGHIVFSEFNKQTVGYTKFKELIEEKQIETTVAKAGQEIILSEECKLDLLWPLKNNYHQNANNASVVMRLDYKEFEMFLAGDIEDKIERRIIEKYGKEKLVSDVLKVAHHGSKSSSDRSFLEKINAKASVISVGKDNWYGHPHKSVIEKLKNTSVFRTDIDGSVEVLTNGEIFKICGERKEKCLNFSG